MPRTPTDKEIRLMEMWHPDNRRQFTNYMCGLIKKELCELCQVNGWDWDIHGQKTCDECAQKQLLPVEGDADSEAQGVAAG